MMERVASTASLNESLDILGEQCLFKLYTQICLCYAIPDAATHAAVISTLTRGLELLTANFPWVAGQVVEEDLTDGDGTLNTFKIRSFQRIPELVVKDLRDDPSIPTMEVLRRANFPFSMLDESVIAPRTTLPSPDDPASQPAPVFMIQANFITGGLLLTFISQHNVMDMVGQQQIMHLLSRACRNEPFTSEEISSGNLDRRSLIPLLDASYLPGSELEYQIMKPAPSQSAPAPSESELTRPPCSWAYFSFSADSLAAVKAVAMKTLPKPTSGYVSTDDALSAFIWQSIMRARLPRLNANRQVTFARSVDVRRYLNLPPTSSGNMTNMTYHTCTLQKLMEAPLGSLAAQLRAAVDPKSSRIGYNTRALATFLSRTEDTSRVGVTATLDLSADIMLSSWAKLGCYDLDFNLGLGKPEVVRRPGFIPVESLIYLMPKASDGEVAVALCLRDDDMQRLRGDQEFARYGSYIG